MVDEIKVGGITYNVRITEDIQGFLYGSCSDDRSEILISTHPSKSKQEQTLIHELVHAIFNEAGLTDEAEDGELYIAEEELVNRIGIVLHQVLTDNDFSFLHKTK